MKRIVLLLSLLSSLCFAVSAEDAAFMLDYHDDYKSAFTQAKKEHKLLMLVQIQNPCPYCERFMENTLPVPEVKEEIKGMVHLILDKSGEMPEKYRTDVTPLTVFIDPQKDISLWETIGYVKVKEFLEEIKEMKKEAAKE